MSEYLVQNIQVLGDFLTNHSDLKHLKSIDLTNLKLSLCFYIHSNSFAYFPVFAAKLQCFFLNRFLFALSFVVKIYNKSNLHIF